MKKLWLIVVLMTTLQGCTGMRVAVISEKEALGKPIDSVIENLKSRGLTCGHEYQSKYVNTGDAVGRVDCSIKEKALVCPESYQIPVSFDLKTRQVLALGKFSRTNCF